MHSVPRLRGTWRSAGVVVVVYPLMLAGFAATFAALGMRRKRSLHQGSLWPGRSRPRESPQKTEDASNQIQNLARCLQVNQQVTTPIHPVEVPKLEVAFYDLLSHPTGRRIWSSVMILGVMVTIHAIVAAGILYIYPEFLPEPGEPGPKTLEVM